ncbi:MAG TPA: hypothetical protein VGO94_04240 [Mycobacteriales bacterium]|jgi:hypothetical protein|nr:hypothetical protein [Mycobacteriales bacterium]
MTTSLPHPKEVRDMLSDMLGRDVTVAPCDAFTPNVTDKHAAAVYVDDQGQVAVLAALDLPLAAWVGASIGLVPAGGAQDQVEDGELSQGVRDNLYEVLNIFSALFNKPGTPHLKIQSMYPPGEAPPLDLGVMLKSLGMRLDLEVTVAGYGSGKIAVVLAR